MKKKKTTTVQARLDDDRRRAALISNVMERLDVFACVLAARQLIDTRNGTSADPAVYDVLRKEHATRLVDAVVALSKVRS